LQGGRGDIQKGRRTGPYNERAGEEKSVRENSTWRTEGKEQDNI